MSEKELHFLLLYMSKLLREITSVTFVVVALVLFFNLMATLYTYFCW